ncbi:MAG TPA: hypothetical protein DCL77_14480 [Prolixibacteraceae bacterium]|jgi:hypothetical protein|nr:hypothetical protein [Prolixibacteraceae bacterium]
MTIAKGFEGNKKIGDYITEFSEIRFPKELCSPLDYSMIQECNQRLISDVISKRDEELIARLKDKGFEFDNRFDLGLFLKTRCRIEILGKKYRLYADDQIIAEWWDTVEITMEENKVTAIYGNAPK